MLQANQDDGYSHLGLFSPAQPTHADAGLPQPVSAPCTTTSKLIGLFAEITGWKMEFSESVASLKRRNVSGRESEPVSGTFSIVDMSVDWPAQKPTGHRGKCDQFVQVIEELVEELQSTRFELSQTRSALAGYIPIHENDDLELVDSFAPQYSRRASDPTPPLQTDSSSLTDGESDDFEVRQDIAVGHESVIAPPFEGWELGGTTGISDRVYLDWRVVQGERISISVGKIESELGVGDLATEIQINPITNEYRVIGSKELNAFFVWDSNRQPLTPLFVTKDWSKLNPGQALVATTSSQIGAIKRFGTRDEDETGWQDPSGAQPDAAPPTARDIAGCLTRHLESSERLLVLRANR